MKIRGVLRDALRQKSVGIIEEIPEKGIVKYGKPAGIVACIVPTTNPDLTPAGNAIYAHQGPRRRHLLSASALEEDLVRDGAVDAGGAGKGRCAGRHPAVPDQGQHPDVASADGARRPCHRDGRTAHGARSVQLWHTGLWRGRGQLDDDHRRDGKHRGSGAQHAACRRLRTSAPAARPTAISSSRPRSSTRCWSSCRRKAAISRTTRRKAALRKAMWDDEGHRTPNTVAIAPQRLAEDRRLSKFPHDRKFIIVYG